MRVHLSLVTLCLTLGTFSFPVKRDVSAAAIESHVTNINTKTKLFDASIAAFPDSGASIIQALNIYSDLVSMEQAMESATNDVNAITALSETDGNVILGLAKALVPNLQLAVTRAIDKKAAITGLPFPGLPSIMMPHLTMLKQDSGALVAALLAKVPAGLMSEAQAQATLVDAALSSVIAAYSS